MKHSPLNHFDLKANAELKPDSIDWTCLGATKLSITTLSITTLSTMGLLSTLGISDTQHNDTQHIGLIFNTRHK
jgi:hypothetical protein